MVTYLRVFTLDHIPIGKAECCWIISEITNGLLKGRKNLLLMLSYMPT
jgi:hypothetical protein